MSGVVARKTSFEEREVKARAPREPSLEQLAALHAEFTELRARALAAPARFEARVAHEEGKRAT